MKMLPRTAVIAAALLLSALTCSAQEGGGAPLPPGENPPGWAYSVSGSYYSFRNQNNFMIGIATADRGPLHLEARYNYEALDSGSLFVGWKFSGGEKLTYELTPILGAVFGQKEGIAPGLEGSAAYSAVDLYIESEYVLDLGDRQDSYVYVWTELGFTPLDWLRFGLAGQRTTVYQSDRDIQRGVFAQLIFGKATLGFYVFNPDDSDSQYSVFSLGAEF
jgi:hypothetical protein